MTLSWEIVDIKIEEYKQLTLQISLPDFLSPTGKQDGSYDEKGHVFIIPVVALTGQVELTTSDVVSTTVLQAAVMDGEKIIASSDLSLAAAEQFQLDSADGEISALDGKVKVEFPEGVLHEPTVIEIGAPSGDEVPEYSLSGRPFEINAYEGQGKQELTHFDQNLVLSVSYADLGVPEGSENDLNLFWYNQESKEWEMLGGYVDTETKTLFAFTDHFTVFDIDVNNWQASHLPTVDAFQVSSFTGAATYSLPIEVPSGPGGFQPSLSLTYNSQVVDQAILGVNSGQQASWVGMGWSLETGSMELDTHGTPNTASDDTYSLNVDGEAPK